MKHSIKEDGRPGLYWFPKDWMTDSGLRVSSLAAKGLWIEMLHLMFFAPTRGTLRHSNNTNITTEDLTNLTYKTDTKTIQILLDELETNEVFGRLKDGTIINRKMYRESEISRIRSEAVSKRWHTKSIQKKNTKAIQSIETGKEKESLDKGLKKGIKVAGKENETAPYGDIVAYLNEKTGSSFPPGADKTQDLIRVLWKKGYTLEQFQKVIDVKVKDWKGDPKMEQYLRPSTLFRKSKFEEYIGQAPKGKTMMETLKEIAEGRDGEEGSGRIIDVDSQDLP